MKKYAVLIAAAAAFCGTPGPVPEITAGKLQISSQRLILAEGERGALFFQTAKQQGLIWLPPQKATPAEEVLRRVSRTDQLATTDADGRAGNWGGVQFSYRSSVITWQRYEFNITVPGFCGGDLRIFFLPERNFPGKAAFGKESLPVDSADADACSADMTPRVSPEILQLAREQARTARPLRYSYRIVSDNIEISFPGDIP